MSRNLNLNKQIGLAHALIRPMAKNEADRKAEANQIAERLRLGRTALNLKAAEVCRLTGIKPNAYSNWENGHGRPKLDEARILRRAFGYTLDWIYEGDRSGLPLKLASAIAELESSSSGAPAKKRGAA